MTLREPASDLKVVGYRSAHERVEEERVPAYLHPCADCGGNAKEWSYDHTDPDELYATDAANMGAAYSLDPYRYSPRCKSCHIRFDRDWARQRRGEPPKGSEARKFAPEAAWEIKAWARRMLGLPDDPLSDVRDLLGGFISAQEETDLDTVALWIAATHLAAHGVGRAFPRLRIVAPSYGAGKSTLLGFVSRLSHRGQTITSTITDAMIPRILRADGYTTLCFDEADKTLRPENANATAILNAGWERGGTAHVLMPDGQGWKPERINVFSPVALAGNGVRLAADTRDRTLTVRLVRSAETPEADWDDWLAGVDDRLRERLQAWAEEAAGLRMVHKPPTADLGGRDRDRWSVLLSVAHGAGGRWVGLTHELAAADRDARKADADAAGRAPNEQLVWDIWAVWPVGETRLSTTDLVTKLAAHNPSLWGIPSGKILTPKSLSFRLGEFYGTRMPTDRFGGRDARERGYTLTTMEKVWRSAGIPLDTDG